MYRIKIEQFEGPMDILLQLIEGEKLDITEVSLAQVTDQYIEYLNQLEEINSEELADFLVVAAKLLYLKSKYLLPSLDLEEEEEDLEKQLKIYKEYLEASRKIQAIIAQKRFSFAREKMPKIDLPDFNPPIGLKKEKLAKIFSEILKGLEPFFILPQETIAKTISIREKIKIIKDLIFQQTSLKFSSLLNKSKIEVIVSFLAILELVKQREIIVCQKNHFEDIIIQKNGQA